MNPMKTLAFCAAALLLAGAAPYAGAHGSVRFGIGIGIPFPAPYYYAPPPYYPYYPPVVVVPPAPSGYVEQAPAQVYSTQPQPGVYYYCPASKAYYPYVRDCPGGWEQVPVQPR